MLWIRANSNISQPTAVNKKWWSDVWNGYNIDQNMDENISLQGSSSFYYISTFKDNNLKVLFRFLVYYKKIIV